MQGSPTLFILQILGDHSRTKKLLRLGDTIENNIHILTSLSLFCQNQNLPSACPRATGATKFHEESLLDYFHAPASTLTSIHPTSISPIGNKSHPIPGKHKSFCDPLLGRDSLQRSLALSSSAEPKAGVQYRSSGPFPSFLGGT